MEICPVRTVFSQVVTWLHRNMRSSWNREEAFLLNHCEGDSLGVSCSRRTGDTCGRWRDLDDGVQVPQLH
jgi:hypothetical protein